MFCAASSGLAGPPGTGGSSGVPPEQDRMREALPAGIARNMPVASACCKALLQAPGIDQHLIGLKRCVTAELTAEFYPDIFQAPLLC